MDQIWVRETDSRLVDLEKHRAVDNVHRANVEKRLYGIEDTLKWLVRLIIGGMLVGLVGFALKGGLLIV
jgi:hypothetical protein|tara:strand:- start:884 stop:1090 length:207 start_codon:yes stop_codon:yes gene_type:complete